MSNYSDLYEDIEDMFLNAISVADLEHCVNIRLLNCDNQKKVTNVAKTTPLVQHLTKSEVIITVNQLVFEQMEELYQQIIIDEALARIFFDAEKGKVVLKQPDFETFSLVMAKYTSPVMLKEREIVKAIYTQGKEDPVELTTGS